jgi:hypothetical protein
VRFNFDLNILYLDISQEEEGFHHFFGVLKETELTRLKYAAIDEAYLFDGVVDLHLTIAGLKRALKAMTDLLTSRNFLISKRSIGIGTVKCYEIDGCIWTADSLI